MKKFLIIFIILLLISSLLAVWFGKRTWDKLKFRVFLKDIDFRGISLEDIAAALLIGGQTNVKVTLGADIQNDNNFSIPFQILKVKLSYEGTLLGETSEELAQQKFKVPSKQTLTISDTIYMTINKESLKLLTQWKLGKKPVIDYVIKIKVLSIPFPFIIRKNFVWE